MELFAILIKICIRQVGCLLEGESGDFVHYLALDVVGQFLQELLLHYVVKRDASCSILHEGGQLRGRSSFSGRPINDREGFLTFSAAVPSAEIFQEFFPGVCRLFAEEELIDFWILVNVELGFKMSEF